MMTVHEVSKLAGVSVRTLQYYDKIGLLPPSEYTKAGYRLYDDGDLEKLQQILLFRELKFPLKDIKRIIDSPDFDKDKALEQQIDLLILKKKRLEELIKFARGIKLRGVSHMEFTAFDMRKIDEYEERAREYWSATQEYREFEEKNKERTLSEIKDLGNRLMAIIAEFGSMKDKPANNSEVQAQVRRLQEFITTNYYTCSNVILSRLGDMYAGGGEFTVNIDKARGKGTAEFAKKAIEIYCK